MSLPEAMTQRGAGRQPGNACETNALFVMPTRRGEGFQASVHGRMLDLADPGSDHGFAPTPDDLFILSIASDLAWTARSYLRARGLAGDVGIVDPELRRPVARKGTEIGAPDVPRTLVEA